MKKVKQDIALVDEVLDRGVAAIYPNRAFLKKRLESGERLTIYLGIDPTGPQLHLGHSIPLRKLAQLQRLGHRVVLLVGDFTALSGDPDKTEARKRLTRKEILENCKKYKEQASKILSFTGANAAEYRFNSDWYSKMSFYDALDLMSRETVQRMLERDLFERRIASGKPLYLHEFLYPLMQAYDSVALMVDGEVGATDQTFNMLTGRDLMKQLKNKEKFVIALKLLEDSTGKKMGKTEGNMVTLDEGSNEMFGKIMSWPDDMIAVAMELLTDIPMDTIRDAEKKMRSGKLNPRDAKAGLAGAVVAQYHSAKDAEIAERVFVETFAKKEVPDDIPEVRAPKGSIALADFLVDIKLVSSKSEARRLVEQGGVKVNQEKVVDWKKSVRLAAGDVVQVGKRRFVRIR